jgi:hypothetical protein
VAISAQVIRGIAKTGARETAPLALANLYLARRELAAA